MSFTSHQILFLQRLVSERPMQRRAAEVSRYFCEQYSLGTAVGRQIEYRDEHLRMAHSLLLSHDLPVEPLAAQASRADAAAFGGLSEKALSAAPHAGSIAVKCIGNCTLEAIALRTPADTYLVVTPDVGHRIACDRLLFIENLETFRQLEKYTWIDYRGQAVLAVFRGDAQLSTGDAARFIRARAEGILAFVDFDPAGLLIANALPADRLERLILPDAEWLRDAANTARGRQLFADQEPKAGPSLERTMNEELRTAWGELKALRSGVTQERMLRAPGANCNRPNSTEGKR